MRKMTSLLIALNVVAIAGAAHADGYASTVGGGEDNSAEGEYATVSGGSSNRADGRRSAIGGGNQNEAMALHATVGGGLLNWAWYDRATIAGGAENAVLGPHGSIGGGEHNVAGAFGSVAGGSRNWARGNFSSIAGGSQNLADAANSAIGGGLANLAAGFSSAIVGGAQNQSSGIASTVSGGWNNCAGADFSWAGGRRAKVRPLHDPQDGSCAGIESEQYPGDSGTFVWADSTNEDFVSSGADQFLIRAHGGMALNSNAVPLTTTLMVKGRTVAFGDAGTTNMYLEHGARASGYNFGVFSDLVTMPELRVSRFNRTVNTNVARFRADGRFEVLVDGPIKPGGGAWSAPSDARLKRDIRPVRGALERVLALRGVEFRYRDDAPASYRVPGVQVGFVAQDVERVFPDWVSKDSDGFRLVGPKGFEALTVEALRELRAEHAAALAELRRQHDAALATLHAENRALREDLVALRSRRDAEFEALREQLALLRELITPAVALAPR